MITFIHSRTGRVIEVGEGLASRYRGNTRWSEQGAAQQVPEGTVQELLDWAGTDETRRTLLLATERAGKQRKGILEAFD